jgi:hypothetical protein
MFPGAVVGAAGIPSALRATHGLAWGGLVLTGNL